MRLCTIVYTQKDKYTVAFSTYSVSGEFPENEIVTSSRSSNDVVTNWRYYSSYPVSCLNHANDNELVELFDERKLKLNLPSTHTFDMHIGSSNV